MNPITKALDDIKFTIPYEILDATFRNDYNNWRNANNSIDEQMLVKIIRPRVLQDCNLVGGVTVVIPFDNIHPSFTDNYNTVYTIPNERTGNRTILSVLSVGYLPFQANFNMTSGNIAYATPLSMNSVTQAAQRIGDAMSVMPVLSNAQIEIVGHNTILVKENYRLSSTYSMRCVLMNDENLTNINPRSFLAFSKLCQLAVRAYIYNKMIVKIDQAFLQGGQELGAFKNIVEGYADSNEMYETHLREVWRATAFMNDSVNYDRYIKLMVSPGI